MKIDWNNTLRCIVALAATALVASASCGRAEPPKDLPNSADASPRYEKPKKPALNSALERCLADVPKAQEELRTLFAEGKVKRRHHPQGGWAAYIKLTNKGNFELYDIAFYGQTERILSFTKFVYADEEHKHELHDLGYEMYFDENGRVEKYQRRSTGLLHFYPNGTLKSFGGLLEDGTHLVARWNEDGKLVSVKDRHLKEIENPNKDK